jgi:hypothetical protein
MRYARNCSGAASSRMPPPDPRTVVDTRTSMRYDVAMIREIAPGEGETATHRHPAHRLYLGAGYDITAFHFGQAI